MEKRNLINKENISIVDKIKNYYKSLFLKEKIVNYKR